MISNVEGLLVQRVTTYGGVLDNWPFFLEGLGRLNDIVTTKSDAVDAGTLLRFLLDCVVGRPTESAIYIVSSKNGKPLSYIIAADNSDTYHKTKSLLVYAIYSNKKSKTASRIAFDTVERWAKMSGYEEIQAYSPRASGAFLRFVKRFFGMSFKLTFLSKKI